MFVSDRFVTPSALLNLGLKPLALRASRNRSVLLPQSPSSHCAIGRSSDSGRTSLAANLVRCHEEALKSTVRVDKGMKFGVSVAFAALVQVAEIPFFA